MAHADPGGGWHYPRWSKERVSRAERLKPFNDEQLLNIYREGVAYVADLSNPETFRIHRANYTMKVFQELHSRGINPDA